MKNAATKFERRDMTSGKRVAKKNLRVQQSVVHVIHVSVSALYAKFLTSASESRNRRVCGSHIRQLFSDALRRLRRWQTVGESRAPALTFGRCLRFRM
jgi:hypothetical protein